MSSYNKDFKTTCNCVQNNSGISIFLFFVGFCTFLSYLGFVMPCITYIFIESQAINNTSHFNVHGSKVYITSLLLRWNSNEGFLPRFLLKQDVCHVTVIWLTLMLVKSILQIFCFIGIPTKDVCHVTMIW